MLRAILVLALSSCVTSSAVTCEDGSICPAGTTCDVARGRCVTFEQTAACRNASDGDDCTVVGAPGTCRAGACEPWVCGDGIVAITESCDGDALAGATCESLGFSMTTTGLACNSLCRFDTSGCSGACGDGAIDGEEQCDDTDLGNADCMTAGFYDPGPLTCTASCAWNTSQCTGSCGDGEINGPELCDGAPPQETCVELGFDAGPSQCSSACSAGFDACGRFGWRSEALPISNLFAFHATSLDERWVAGVGGATARFANGAWTAIATPVTTTLDDVYSVSASRAWALSRSVGTLLAWDGSAWSVVTGGPAGPYERVWGTATAAFVATNAGVWSWDGAAWARVGTKTQVARGIAGTSATDVWAAFSDGVHRWTGTAWEPMGLVADLRRMVALPNGEVLATGRTADGSAAIIAAWNGTAWMTWLDATTGFSAIAGTASNDIWVVSSTRMRHFDGQRWIRTNGVTADGIAFVGVVAFGVGKVVAASSSLSYRYRGQLLMSFDAPFGGAAQSIATDGTDTIFLGANAGRVHRKEDSGWVTETVFPDGALVRAMWTAGPSFALAGGSNGELRRFDGTSWTLEHSGLGAIAGIIGTGLDDLWVFGATPQHLTGGVWTARPLPGGGLVSGVSAGATDDVWVTTTSTVHRWSNGAWSEPLMPAHPTALAEIAAISPTDVYVARRQRNLLRYDGTSWTSVPLPVVSNVEYVAATASDDVFAASVSEVVHYDGQRWSPIRIPLVATADIIGIVARPHRVDILATTPSTMNVYSLMRTRPWVCRATELACNDGVDDDCDDAIDARDTDCP